MPVYFCKITISGSSSILWRGAASRRSIWRPERSSAVEKTSSQPPPAATSTLTYTRTGIGIGDWVYGLPLLSVTSFLAG